MAEVKWPTLSWSTAALWGRITSSRDAA